MSDPTIKPCPACGEGVVCCYDSGRCRAWWECPECGYRSPVATLPTTSPPLSWPEAALKEAADLHNSILRPEDVRELAEALEEGRRLFADLRYDGVRPSWSETLAFLELADGALARHRDREGG